MISLQNIGFFIQIISSFVAYLLTISPVGYFKAWVASVCGDDTAEQEGFMTLDPLVHCDFIGMVALMLFGIGWGRNVPVNLALFYDPYRKLKIASALFAPSLMHALLTCFAATLSFIIFSSQAVAHIENYPLMLVVARIVMSFILLNSFLAVMSLFINVVVVSALFISERYATIAQHIYNIILLGPLALLLILELFGIHVLSILHAIVLQSAFFVGRVIAGFFGIH